MHLSRCGTSDARRRFDGLLSDSMVVANISVLDGRRSDFRSLNLG